MSATDTTAHTREYPLAGGAAQVNGHTLPRLLYQVNDAYNPNVAWTPGSLSQDYSIMTEFERQELQGIDATGDLNSSNAQMQGTFIHVDGTGVDIRFNVGLRNRGHGSRTGGPPSNEDVVFANDQPWNGQVDYIINRDHVYLQASGMSAFQLAGLVGYDATLEISKVNNNTSQNTTAGSGLRGPGKSRQQLRRGALSR